MITDFHFLRPYWLLALIPLIGLALSLWKQKPASHAWEAVCDPHLLDHLLKQKAKGKPLFSLSFLLLSLLFMILSISGPTWYKFPAATYKTIQPRVLLLNMSENMMQDDLTPNRLSRAKFKLQDLFSRKNAGQFGLVVYTGEPFIVSPLTDDSTTISSLLSDLTPDIMPVEGENLDSALHEASQLLKQAGYNHGQILVLTSNSPSSASIEKANKLSAKGIYSSIMPITADKNLNPLYERFARAGKGQLIPYSSDSDDLEQWLKNSNTNEEYTLNEQDNIPLWRDEGPWFLIPALILLLPVFRRGWLQRVAL